MTATTHTTSTPAHLYAIITGGFVLVIFGGRCKDYRLNALPAGSRGILGLNFRNRYNFSTQVMKTLLADCVEVFGFRFYVLNILLFAMLLFYRQRTINLNHQHNESELLADRKF